MVARRKKKKRRTNRGKQAGFLFPRPLAVVLAVAALLALTYLWLCGRSEALARSIKTMEEQRGDVHRRVVNEEYKWSNLCTPKRIEQALARFRVGMTWPSEDRVLHLARPLRAEEPLVAAVAPPDLYAQHRLAGDRHD